MTDYIISSRHNQHIKSLVALKKRRERDEAGVTLVEGFEELSIAMQSGITPKTLYYCPDLMHDDAEHALLKKIQASGATLFQLSQDVFARIAYRESPDGWLAVVPKLQTSLDNLKIGRNPLLLIAEGVEKPGNLGAMLRTADAAGVDAVIATDSATDWGNPNIIRASKGAVFSIPVADTTNDTLLRWLHECKITIIATTPSATQPYTKTQLTGPLAVVVGTEKQGLTDFWLQHADQKVLIPMHGQVDSLNVATSAALVLYEAVRQRSLT